MTSDEIARDYLRRVQGRREALRVFLERQLHADVVRESQEIVELALKGALRFVGVDPPKRHARRALAVVDRLVALYERLLRKE